MLQEIETSHSEKSRIEIQSNSVAAEMPLDVPPKSPLEPVRARGVASGGFWLLIRSNFCATCSTVHLVLLTLKLIEHFVLILKDSAHTVSVHERRSGDFITKDKRNNCSTVILFQHKMVQLVNAF